MKSKYQSLFQASAIFIILFGGIFSVSAQNKWSFQDDGCGAVRWYGSPSGAFDLNIKEQTLTAPPKKLSIDGGQNGGIRIVGWQRNEIFIRACVQAFGIDSAEARAKTETVVIETKDDFIRAVSSLIDNSFGANFDIRVPVNTDLTIKANNGGVNISNVRGALEFDLNNGGAILSKIAGSVRGKTINGSLTFKLSGERWEGSGIDANTTNGDILISLPENYSAVLETGTRRGKFYTNLPVEKGRANNYELNLNLGTGGAKIKALTTNGQVTIKSQNAIGEQNK